jgi:dipeptidyl aminopeptidase/acylaminoacyl peptidase
MTDSPRRSAFRGRREQQVLDWLGEPEQATAAAVMDLAFAELPKVRQLRPWPWTRLLDRIRPEPIGSPQVRAIALVAVAALLLALLAGTLLLVGRQPRRDRLPAVLPPVVQQSPAALAATGSPPSAASASTATFPLASPGYLVIVSNEINDAFTIRTDDGQRRPVAADLTGRAVSPEWAPDGKTALLLEQTTSSEQLWDVDVTGARRSLVIITCVKPCESRNEASWSHDGGRIVFFQALGAPTDGIPQTCGLALYDATTQVVSSVTSSPCAVIEERHPRFSPDDSRLAFWRSRAAGGVRGTAIEDSAIFTRDVATGRETQVTDWSIHASMLDWSPDARWITFIPDYWNDAAPAADIWRIHPDGTGLERLTTLDTSGVRILRPRYTPDGKWLVFLRVTPGNGANGELMAIPANGGRPVSVLPGINVLDFDVRAGS